MQDLHHCSHHKPAITALAHCGRKQMNIVTAIIAYLGELERRRLHRRTERLIGTLPSEVQKDIGWPGSARGIDGQTRHMA
jgi:hypothetical protein